MATEEDLFKIRTELAAERFSKIGKDCNAFNGAYCCTGKLEIRFSQDKFVAECTTCGDQVSFESRTYQAEVERVYLLQMIVQPDVGSVSI